ncbi:hypothetical protein ACFY05_32465 [Microtetraspora fusca]|uniref:Uncharacterized protein n=1 Tax=Microtetraspora fusca TaxID=1997 RepID=A0ABW6VE45_MICFU
MPELLGALLAVVELELASRVQPAVEPPIGLAEQGKGWSHTIGDEALTMVLLVNRIQRTVYDLELATGGLDEDESRQRIGAAAAVNALLASITLIDAHVQEPDRQRVRHALDRALTFLALSLMELNTMRMTYGDDNDETA